MAHVNLVKLCVGADSIEDLARWQAERGTTARAKGLEFLPEHVTRMWPKRGDEVLAGGSLYWVIKGQIACRQRIVGLEPREGTDGITRCAIVMEDHIQRVAPAPRRPFQGWRYLAAGDAPPDLGRARASDDDLPPEVASRLADIGVL